MAKRTGGRKPRITDTLVAKAVQAAGGPVAVAFHLELTGDQAVRAWIWKDRVPADHVIRLCELGGNKITPQQLRPDMFAGVGA